MQHEGGTMDPVPEPIPFVLRDPDYYRRVAWNEKDVDVIRACLLLAADELDRWRGTVGGEQKRPTA